MKLFIVLLLALVSCTTLIAQDFYSQELLNLSDISRLPLYRSGEMNQLSSYDRTGGNDDGFSGKYSAVRADTEGLVVADLKGPGVVNRIWTPTPTPDTIRFYFDGEKKPRIAVPFIDLFTGKHAPFVTPLCGNEVGGYYCYLPIPYEKSLKIVYRGKLLRFHQTQYRTLSSKDNVRSFTMQMFQSHQAELSHVADVWNKTEPMLDQYGATLKTKRINLTLKAGEEQSLFTLTGGGRIVGLQLDAGSLVPHYRNVSLTARWDKEQSNAIDAPLHDFFGFAFGKPAMRSMLLGTNGEYLYCYIPMPVDESAEVKVKHLGSKSEIQLSGTVYYTNQKRDPRTEGKFYVQSRRHYNIPSGVSHTIADVKGKGHHIGSMLITQGLENGSTWYFEGDDRATIDGTLRLHGTGSEDYFNGGWYAVIDRWDRKMSLPIHGCLEYDMMTSRTGGYRFYLTDKLNFEKTFQLTIEHQPDANNNVRTDYTSLGFFYADKPVFVNTPIILDTQTQLVSRREKMTPQGMVYSLYWLATANYEEPSIVFSMKESDQWFAKIDPEAVPIVQITLDKLDNGKYKVYAEYELLADSGPFSVWQRSRQVSDWITGKTTGEAKPVGEIEITDELKTLTIRKKSQTTSVRIINLQFEKISP